jgi:hypothetical protein
LEPWQHLYIQRQQFTWASDVSVRDTRLIVAAGWGLAAVIAATLAIVILALG